MRTWRLTWALTLATLTGLGCSSTSLESPSEAALENGKSASGQEIRKVTSADGRFDGEVSGTPAPGSKFAALRIGMTWAAVQKQIGDADQLYSHDTGKRWIPFYAGTDARRIVMHYRGEGCLGFTGGNLLGGGTNALVRIDVDPAGKCYRP